MDVTGTCAVFLLLAVATSRALPQYDVAEYVDNPSDQSREMTGSEENGDLANIINGTPFIPAGKGRCSSLEFQCDTTARPQCVSPLSVCDGATDCFNGRDEANCSGGGLQGNTGGIPGSQSYRKKPGENTGPLMSCRPPQLPLKAQQPPFKPQQTPFKPRPTQKSNFNLNFGLIINRNGESSFGENYREGFDGRSEGEHSDYLASSSPSSAYEFTNYQTEVREADGGDLDHFPSDDRESIGDNNNVDDELYGSNGNGGGHYVNNGINQWETSETASQQGYQINERNNNLGEEDYYYS